jgi:replication factor C large subunit
MAAAYDLDEAGVAFVTGSGESTNKVESVVADAQALRDERMEDHAEGAFAGGRQAAADSGDGAGPAEDADAAEAEAAGDGGPSESAGDAGDADGDDAEDGGQSGLSDFV